MVGGVGEGGKNTPQDPDPGDDPTGARKRAPSPKRPEEVDQGVWDDWLALRKAKKAPVTPTVLDMAQREAEKAKMPLTEFLRVWCVRGTQGLQADWIRPEERRQGPAVPAETFRERDERNARQRWEEMTGRVHPDNLKPAGLVIDITPAAAPLIPIGAAK